MPGWKRNAKGCRIPTASAAAARRLLKDPDGSVRNPLTVQNAVSRTGSGSSWLHRSRNPRASRRFAGGRNMGNPLPR